MQREMTDGRVLLRITGRFDPASALLLERELVKEDETEEVVLDFASVDELGDASHERLLKYFGIELDEHGGVRGGPQARH